MNPHSTVWLVMALIAAPLGVGNGTISHISAPSTKHDSAIKGDGAAAFARIKTLVGEWTAPMDNGIMTNVFRPIGEGSAILHEEWLQGRQLTATVFYMVGDELRADHFCDLKNQPRYVARIGSDPNAIVFELREILNADTHPRHFRATTWHFRDSTHLTQEWQGAEHGKDLRNVRMEFTRVK